MKFIRPLSSPEILRCTIVKSTRITAEFCAVISPTRWFLKFYHLSKLFISWRFCIKKDIPKLGRNVSNQIRKSLDVDGAIAKKYSGGGYGGYALYLFSTQEMRDCAVNENQALRAVEPV